MRGLRLLAVAALAAVASAQLGASWPTGPVARPSERADRAPVERAASVRLDASSSRRRLVAEEDSERDIALIMLWSAIGLIFIGYFTFSALFRMEVENDALLYSKVRATPPARAVPASPPRLGRPPLGPSPLGPVAARPARRRAPLPLPRPAPPPRRRRRHPAHPPRPARRRQRRTRPREWSAQSCGCLIYIAAAPLALSVRTAAPAPARGRRSARNLRRRAAEATRRSARALGRRRRRSRLPARSPSATVPP